MCIHLFNLYKLCGRPTACVNQCKLYTCLKNFSTELTKSHMCVRRREHGCIDCTAYTHTMVHMNINSISINSSKENPEHLDPSSMEWCLYGCEKVQLPLKNLSLSNNALEKNIRFNLPVVLPRKTFRRWIRWIVLVTVNAQEAILHIRHLLHHNFTQIPEKCHEYKGFVLRSKLKPGLFGWPPCVSNAYCTCFEKTSRNYK